MATAWRTRAPCCSRGRSIRCSTTARSRSARPSASRPQGRRQARFRPVSHHLLPRRRHRCLHCHCHPDLCHRPRHHHRRLRHRHSQRRRHPCSPLPPRRHHRLPSRHASRLRHHRFPPRLHRCQARWRWWAVPKRRSRKCLTSTCPPNASCSASPSSTSRASWPLAATGSSRTFFSFCSSRSWCAAAAAVRLALHAAVTRLGGCVAPVARRRRTTDSGTRTNGCNVANLRPIWRHVSRSRTSQSTSRRSCRRPRSAAGAHPSPCSTRSQDPSLPWAHLHVRTSRRPWQPGRGALDVACVDTASSRRFSTWHRSRRSRAQIRHG